MEGEGRGELNLTGLELIILEGAKDELIPELGLSSGSLSCLLLVLTGIEQTSCTAGVLAFSEISEFPH